MFPNTATPFSSDGVNPALKNGVVLARCRENVKILYEKFIVELLLLINTSEHRNTVF